MQMKRFLLFWCLSVLLWGVGCGEKKTVSRSGDEPVQLADFMEFFPAVQLPYTIADSTLRKKSSDSSRIAYSIFAGFVPDTVLQKNFGKAEPGIYPLGRVVEDGGPTYLFMKAEQGTKRIAYVMCFDREGKYLNTLPLVNTTNKDEWAYGSLDKKFQITTYRQKKPSPGGASFKRNVYIFNNSSADFALILTEPNEEIMQVVINPIDTLTQKNKYTGDYLLNKKNFISFRDGKNPSELQFFIHFEKNGGKCVGELKGVARMNSPKTAYYREPGNPCELEFSFTNTSVSLKEKEGCGSYRDITCFFEGVYPKKKKAPLKKST